MTLVGVFKILLSREDDEVEQTLQTFFSKMYVIGKVVCFILAIIFTVIAVITNSQNSNRRVPPTRPFFTKETWVEDFYEGELYYALLKATKYDVIFLMLYAPWDADSQNARSEFETTCRYFHKKVYCAAVNCWQANANCKIFFDNIAMYPLFLVDLHHIPSIKYNGEHVASHMIHFLSTIVAPLERVISMEKFHILSNSCDALVISFLPDYKWYLRYYIASLKHLEYDPRRDICWSVVTDAKLANSLSLKPFTVKLYMWNETKIYNDTFSSKNIVKWVIENSHFLTRWLFFKNSKNTLLSDLLEHNQAVILFTPRNMYSNLNPWYLMFKEVALELKHCSVDIDIENKQFYIEEQRRKIMEEYNIWKQVCKNRFNYTKTSHISTIFSFIDENYEKCVFSPTISQNYTRCYLETNDASRKSIIGSAMNDSIFDPSTDDRSPQNLVLLHVRERCRRWNILNKSYIYSYFTNRPEYEINSPVSNALCRINNTFTFFAVDSLLYSHFATALGINLNRYTDHTTVVIFSNKDEESFVLQDEFNNKNVLYKFLIDFANRTIPRWLKSTEDPSIYLNHYNKSNNLMSNEIAIEELNTRTFQTVVFNSTQHVVVYYYSPYCSYCQVSAHTFLSVANAFKNFTQITFARIDGENNDLSWYLVAQSYPTIILFPAERKSESVVYSQMQEITVENLFEFVLSNVNVEIKLKMMIDECNRYRNIEYKAACVIFNKCINNARTYCLHLINNLVKKYKNYYFNNNASSHLNISLHSQKILTRLKYLKSIYFSLENI